MFNMLNDNECFFLVGIPGSGKSTWADKYCLLYPIFSTDDIIENIADYYGMTYTEIFQDVIKFAEKRFFKYIEESNGYPVVIDRTNLSVESRKRIMDILRPKGYTFKAVVFPIPDKEELERRLASRPGKNIPPHVIESMITNFQHPTVDEGFSEIVYI